MPSQGIEQYRRSLYRDPDGTLHNVAVLAYNDFSPAKDPLVQVFDAFYPWMVQRFTLTTDDVVVGYFPKADSVLVGERFGFYDIISYDDDPGFENESDTFKVIRAEVVVEEGFASMYEAQLGKVAMQVEFDDAFPRYRFAIPFGGGIVHEIIVDGSIDSALFINTKKEEKIWVVTTSATIAFRLHIQKDRFKIHGYPLPERGNQDPYRPQ